MAGQPSHAPETGSRLADVSPAALLRLTPVLNAQGTAQDFEILEWNAEAIRQIGGVPPPMLSQVTGLGDPSELLWACLGVVASGNPRERVVRVSTRLGPRWYQQRWALDGDSLTGSSLDITAWRADLESNEASSRFLDSIIENVPAMIFVKDAEELRFVRFNQAGETLLGVPREELIGKNDYDFFPAAQARAFQDKDRETLERGELLTVQEEPIETANGARWLHTMKIPVKDEGGIVRHLLGISIDITEKRRQEADQRLHSIILATMSEGVCLIRDSDLTFSYTNPKFERMLGYEPGELLGQPVTVVNAETELSAQQVAQQIINLLRTQGEATYEVQNRRKDGSSLWCRVHASGFESPDLGRAWIAVHEDITERRELQATVALEDRMNSLGRLAAGVAHEVNNPLTYVKTNVELLGEDVRDALDGASLQPLREAAPMIADIREGVDRIRQIVRSLQFFSRSGHERRAPMDVRVVLDHSLRMVAHDLRPRARVVKQYAEVLPVSADETRLGQVFVNLLANASDSIEEGRPVANEVRLRTRTEGSRVIIEIEDTGAGIPPDALERIFDPFFTTKPVGDGPGLGLSVCHGIIKSLGGTIEVRSTVGKGTTFRVSLPAIESTNAGDPITIGAAEPVRRILVVDDEVSILKSVRLIFSRHDVVALADAREALELLRRGEQFDLILCDLMMPNFTGIDLHNALARERPDVADSIVFMTGGVFTGLGRQFLDRIPNERVEKPFEHGALRALLLTLRN